MKTMALDLSRVISAVIFATLSLPGKPDLSLASTLRCISCSGPRLKYQTETEGEDFSSLRLATPLIATPPLGGEVSEHQDFTIELMQVGWRKGDPVDLYVIKPKRVEKPPIIMFLYGYPSEADRFNSEEFCRLVTKGGFAAVGFVEAWDGHRYHDRPMRQWFVSELHDALVMSVHDVQMVLNYVSSRSDLDVNRIGMFGQGSGGTIAILAASVDARITAINALDPWGDWPRWVEKSALIPEDERPGYKVPAFLDKLAALDPIRVLPNLIIPVHVQDALYEKGTPRDSKEHLESALPRLGSVARYATPNDFQDAVADGKLLDWLKDQVRAANALGR
jgi:Acetyl xylan esterase (AXE1)